MKKIKLLPAFFALFSMLVLSSCTTDPIDSDIVNQDVEDNGGNNGGGSNNGGGNNGGGNNGGGSATGSYWPMAVNNDWNYSVNSGGSENVKITGTETIENKLYYKLNNMFGTSSAGVAGTGQGWVRQENGSYMARIKTSMQNGVNLSPIELILLKDNLAAGQTWTQNISQTITYDIPGVPPMQMEISIEGKIIEKDVALQVGSQTFTNVIHAKVTQNAMTATTVTDYYFAKNVGPVKIVMGGAGINRELSITSYSVN